MAKTKKTKKTGSDKKPASSRKKLMPPSEALTRATPGKMQVGSSEKNTEKYVCYGIRHGDKGLLLESSTACEVVQSQRIFDLPGTVNWFLGLTNLRGNLVPIFNIFELFEFVEPEKKTSSAAQSSKQNKLFLIIGKNEDSVGIVVNSYPVILNDPGTSIDLPPLPTALEGHVSNGYLLNDQLWLDFNYSSFFADLSSTILAS